MKHKYFKVTVIFVLYMFQNNNDYMTLAVLIRIGHTKTVSDFKKLKTCLLEPCLLSNSHSDSVSRSRPFSKSHTDCMLSIIKS